MLPWSRRQHIGRLGEGRRVFAASRSAVKQRRQRGQDVGLISAASRNSVGEIGSAVVFARDLADEIDNAAARLRVLYPHECLGQREPIGGRQKIGDISRRWRVAETAGLSSDLRRVFVEKGYRYLQDERD